MQDPSNEKPGHDQTENQNWCLGDEALQVLVSHKQGPHKERDADPKQRMGEAEADCLDDRHECAGNEWCKDSLK